MSLGVEELRKKDGPQESFLCLFCLLPLFGHMFKSSPTEAELHR